ncbi:MAG: DUF1830 domain-containing protein [Cyanobacteriota bacterium]|nr:DUF1830 domain-containing protein [Cyanobacteriota bacterium]
MTLTIDKIPGSYGSKKLCCYSNRSTKVQVVRITNIENWYLERVVFPWEDLLFEAPSEAELEVYQDQGKGVQLQAKYPCTNLQVEEGFETSA